jgi:hypothetical protein
VCVCVCVFVASCLCDTHTHTHTQYDKYIKKKMDFTRMTARSERGYNFDKFTADLNLLCDNCMYFNEEETIYYKAAAELKTYGSGLIAAAKQQFEAFTGIQEAKRAARGSKKKKTSQEEQRRAEEEQRRLAQEQEQMVESSSSSEEEVEVQTFPGDCVGLTSSYSGGPPHAVLEARWKTLADTQEHGSQEAFARERELIERKYFNVSRWKQKAQARWK